MGDGSRICVLLDKSWAYGISFWILRLQIKFCVCFTYQLISVPGTSLEKASRLCWYTSFMLKQHIWENTWDMHDVFRECVLFDIEYRYIRDLNTTNPWNGNTFSKAKPFHAPLQVNVGIVCRKYWLQLSCSSYFKPETVPLKALLLRLAKPVFSFSCIQ